MTRNNNIFVCVIFAILLTGCAQKAQRGQHIGSQPRIEQTQPERTAISTMRRPNTSGRTVHLTFDDGPLCGPNSPTIRLLNLLAYYRVTATFFVTGVNVARCPDVVRRMVDEGHTVGNHTWGHPDLRRPMSGRHRSRACLRKFPNTKRGRIDCVLWQIRSTDEAIRQATGGYTPPFVRLPFGAGNKTVRSLIRRPIINWDSDPKDWRDRNASTVHRRVVDAVTQTRRSSTIIVLHDIHPTTVDAMEKTIPAIIKAGMDIRAM